MWDSTGLDSKGQTNIASWITEQVTGVVAGSLSPHVLAVQFPYLLEVLSQVEGTSELSVSPWPFIYRQEASGPLEA